jgi:hypothetical protein
MQFVCAPISSPNAGADLPCQVMQNQIGSKPGDSSSLKQVRAEPMENAIVTSRSGGLQSAESKAIADLKDALRERLAIIHDEESRRDEAKHLARLRTVSEKIENLQAALPQPIDPQLAHYLQRKSYDKALEFLKNL